MDDIFSKNLEFDWDEWNVDKNWIKHKVRFKEAEDAFFDKFAFVTKDVKHSTVEPRYQLLGKTKKDRKLTVYFTLRGEKIRVISTRSMSRKERKQYEKVQDNTKV